MDKYEKIAFVAKVVGALTGCVALLISYWALRVAQRAYSLRDRPILYVVPGPKMFYGPTPTGNISNDDLLFKGVPLSNVLRYDQGFEIKNATQIIAKNVSLNVKYKCGSKEGEFAEKTLDFFPPEEKGTIYCKFNEELTGGLKSGMACFIVSQIKYSNAYDETFENEQYFKIEFMISKNTFRGINAVAISKKYWGQAPKK